MARLDNDKDEIRITYLVNGKEQLSATVNVDKFADAIKQIGNILKEFFIKNRQKK